MIRRQGKNHAYRVTAVSPTARGRTPQSEREPIPGVSVRCQCGRVVRIKANGRPRAHDYCKFAPATI